MRIRIRPLKAYEETNEEYPIEYGSNTPKLDAPGKKETELPNSNTLTYKKVGKQSNKKCIDCDNILKEKSNSRRCKKCRPGKEKLCHKCYINVLVTSPDGVKRSVRRPTWKCAIYHWTCACGECNNGDDTCSCGRTKLN